MAKRRSTTKPTTAPFPASFIFRGTVQRAKASTVRDVKPDARTAIVRVDEVIAAPPALARIAGREVTVVDGPKALKPGEQAVFYAGSASFGESVAVRATRAEPLASAAKSGGILAARAAAAPLAATPGAAVDPVQAHRDLLLKRSLDNADVVVSGTITEIRMAPETRAMAEGAVVSGGGTRAATTRGRRSKRLTAGGGPQTRISEHDPLWREAVVNVESVEKGASGQKQVVVRFPGSNDVRWRNHPKLRTGQQGVFLLNESGRPGGARALSTRAKRFTTSAGPAALGAMQATGEPQPISAIEKVRQLLSPTQAAPGATRTRATSRARSTRKRKTTRRSRKVR